MPTSRAPRTSTRSQLCSTFVRNHASAVLARDFLVAVSATFRVLYVFAVLEVGTRRLRYWTLLIITGAEAETSTIPASEWAIILYGRGYR